MDMERTIERLASSISSLGRSEVEKRLKNFKGSFRLDFTDEYLGSLTIDRLRHMLFAAITAKFKKKSN